MAQQSLVRVISFDVFDTLVHRRLPHPDYTKVPACRKLQVILASAGIDSDLEELLDERDQVEIRLREQIAANGGDPEAGIDQVFASWVDRYDLADRETVVSDLLEAEVEAELGVTYALDPMIELLTNLHQAGFRLVYSSDMYLRRWMVDRILQACGYGDIFTAGYVSCELGKAKYSGRMFEEILADQEVASDRLIHVGDNRRSDVGGASRAGVRGIRLVNPAMRERHIYQARVRHLARRNRFWEGAKWVQLNVASEDHMSKCHDNEDYRWGYLVFGPALVNFLHRIMHEVAEEEIGTVVFASSASGLLKAIFDPIMAASGYEASMLSIQLEPVLPELSSALGKLVAQPGNVEPKRLALVGLGWNRELQDQLRAACADQAEPIEVAVYNMYDHSEVRDSFALFVDACAIVCGEQPKRAADSEGTRDAVRLGAIQAGILDYASDYANSVPYQIRPPKLFTHFHLSKCETLFRDQGASGQVPAATEDRGNTVSGCLGVQQRPIVLGADGLVLRKVKSWFTSKSSLNSVGWGTHRLPPLHETLIMMMPGQLNSVVRVLKGNLARFRKRAARTPTKS